MHGVNKVILVGNATRDAERHESGSGTVLTNVRLATNRVVAGADGRGRCFSRPWPGGGSVRHLSPTANSRSSESTVPTHVSVSRSFCRLAEAYVLPPPMSHAAVSFTPRRRPTASTRGSAPLLADNDSGRSSRRGYAG